MVKIVVLYGQPTDPAAFDQYYQQTHIPIAQKIPNVKRFEFGHVLGTLTGDPAPYYLQAELYFESPEQMQASLNSDGGQAAAGDVANFATGGVTFIVVEA
ncbi:MAG TPA: EthD family reductase [Ktedonobacterales bacterium]